MRKEELKKGLYVYYVSLGICQISDTTTMEIDGHSKDYIILKSIDPKNDTKLFIPLDNPSILSNILLPLDQNQINDALKQEPKQIAWNTNKRERQELFTAYLHSHNILDLINLIICLDTKSKQLKMEKKNLSTSDGEILKKARQIITEAVSFAFKISIIDASNFINNKGLSV